MPENGRWDLIRRVKVNISLHYVFSNGVLLLSWELQVVGTLHVVATRTGREDGGMSVITFVFRMFLVDVPFLWFILDAEVQLRFQSHVFYFIYSYSCTAIFSGIADVGD